MLGAGSFAVLQAATYVADVTLGSSEEQVLAHVAEAPDQLLVLPTALRSVDAYAQSVQWQR